MLSTMRRPAIATLVLAVLWVSYALTAAWLLYEATPALSRPLLVILGGYSALLALVTGLIVACLRAKRVAGPGGT
jgi:hypothetical protein